MIKLIKKELKLVLSPVFLIFTALVSMVAIPYYPAWVGMFYCLNSIQPLFSMAVANKDLEFSVMLPISRDDIIWARHFDVFFLEILHILAAIPFALLQLYVISPDTGITGMMPNLAFFGMVLVAYSLYNLVFLPWHFKSAVKAVGPMLLGILVYGVMVGVFEVLIAVVPVLGQTLNSLSPEFLWARFVALAVGIAVYAATLLLSYKLSAKNFRKVSL